MLGETLTFTIGGSHVMGTVRYVGPLQEDHSGQEYLGVELSEPLGRHSGRRYFSCAERHGVFVKASTAAAAASTVNYTSPTYGPLFTEYLAGMKAAAEGAGVHFLVKPRNRLGPGDTLILVDLQYDFLPGGAFGVQEGTDILPSLASLITAGATAGATIICTRDYHPIDHASFRSQGGPFPPHCVQGGRGSKLAAPIAAAAAAARKRSPGSIEVAFKGYHRDVDSFGGFEYTETLAEGRLVQRPPPHPSTLLSWTGCALLTCSAIDEDVNAPPDVLAHEEKQTLAQRLGDVRTMYVAGLALDFCVVDTALTAREAGFEDVYVLIDCSRASHVQPVGFLTPPHELWAKLHKGGVKLCFIGDMFPMS